MAFIRTIFEGGKGIYDVLTLKRRIAEAQQKLAKPILEQPDLKIKDRFVFARSIREASLHRKLETALTKEERLQVKQTHIEKMRKEYKMNKAALKKQVAYRDEVAFLGLALQEIALCLDEHVEAFKKSTHERVKEFERESSGVLSEHIRKIQTVESEMTHRMERCEKNFQMEIGKVLTGHRQKAEEIQAQMTEVVERWRAVVQELHAEGERFFQEQKRRIQETRDQLSRLKRNVLIWWVLTVATLLCYFHFTKPLF
jgi:hypothetical protein